MDLVSGDLANAFIRFRIFFSSVGLLWSSTKVVRSRESRNHLIPSLLTYSLHFLFLSRSEAGACLVTAPLCPHGDGLPESHLCLWLSAKGLGTCSVSCLMSFNELRQFSSTPDFLQVFIMNIADFCQILLWIN